MNAVELSMLIHAAGKIMMRAEYSAKNAEQRKRAAAAAINLTIVHPDRVK
jgi:hypothetical protein